MKKTESISKQYHQRLTDLQNTITETNEKLAEAEKALAAAKEEEKKAVLNADKDAYLKAKKEQADASGAIELYTRRLAYIQTEPKIEREELKEAIKTIQDEFAAEQDIARKKILDLAEQIWAVGSDLDAKGEEAKNALYFLFIDVAGNSVNPYTLPGAPHDGTVQYAIRIIRDGFYETNRGKLFHEGPKLFFG